VSYFYLLVCVKLYHQFRASKRVCIKYRVSIRMFILKKKVHTMIQIFHCKQQKKYNYLDVTESKCTWMSL